MTLSTKRLSLLPTPQTQQELLKFLDINFKRIVDLFAQQTVSGDLVDGLINEEQLHSQLVLPGDRLFSLPADKITEGNLEDGYILAGNIRTSNKNARVVYDSSGIKQYTTGGVLAFSLDANRGTVYAPQLIQAGVVSVTHTAQALKNTADVSFARAFLEAPTAVVANADVGRSDVMCTTGGFTTQDFDLTTRQINDTAITATFNVYYIAYGGRLYADA